MVRVGIIGLGGMGNKHLGCYEQVPGAEVVALADIVPEKLKPGESSLEINIGAGGGRIDPEKQKLYSTLWDYYDGRHPLRYSTKRLQEVFKSVKFINLLGTPVPLS